MAVERLHIDEVDDCIVLIRIPGDRWQVVNNQADCDWIRDYEVQSPGKRRLGATGFDGQTHFVRVQRVDEEPIERPEGETR